MDPNEVRALFDLAGMVELGPLDDAELRKHAVAWVDPMDTKLPEQQERVSLVPHKDGKHVAIVLHGKRSGLANSDKPSTVIWLERSMAKRVARAVLLMVDSSA